MEKDPVCGMLVDPRIAPESRLYHGRNYYFCSIGCAGKFSRSAENYVGAGDKKNGLGETHAHLLAMGPVRDLVCGMEVEPYQNEFDYEGIHYAFCSMQCRERFVATPHLYVGTPGHPAPKHTGVEVIKRRVFLLDQVPAVQVARTLEDGLKTMMGVKEVHIEADRVSLIYDLLQATAEQIEVRIAELGPMLGSDWVERLRRGFVHSIEDCEISSMAAPYVDRTGLERR